MGTIFVVENIVQKFRSKNLGKKIWVKKKHFKQTFGFLGQKNFELKFFLVQTNILGQTNYFGSNKFFRSKTFLVKKNFFDEKKPFWSEKHLGQKRFWVKNIFGSKKLMAQKM